MTEKGLPTSDQLATLLLEAADTAAKLGREYWEKWSQAHIRRRQRNQALTNVVAVAWASGAIDGKNAEQRAAQLDSIVNGNHELIEWEASLLLADTQVKLQEAQLEAARVYRAALHDLVDLRVAELGTDAANRKERLQHVKAWR